jgi:hypothetical protein
MKLFTVLLALMVPLMGFAEETKKPHEVLKAIHGNAHIFLTAKPCPLPGVIDHWPYGGWVTHDVTGESKVFCWGRVEYKVEGRPVEMAHLQFSVNTEDFAELYFDMFLQPHSFPNGGRVQIRPKPVQEYQI